MQCLSCTRTGECLHKEKEVIFDNMKTAYGSAPIVSSVNRENKYRNSTLCTWIVRLSIYTVAIYILFWGVICRLVLPFILGLNSFTFKSNNVGNGYFNGLSWRTMYKTKNNQDSDSGVPTMFCALLDKKAYFKSCTFSKMLVD